MICRVSLVILAATLRVWGVVDFAQEVRPVLVQYCFKCHGAEKQKGGVRLDEGREVAAIYREVKTWDKALVEMREGAMPPEEKPQPSEEERRRVVEWLDGALNRPDPEAMPRDPGRAFPHRLSRLEYNNTVRDLLGVETRPADAFPPDGGGGGGFDNNSATLFIPPVLVEKYLAAGSELLAALKVPPGDPRTFIADFTTRAFRRPAETAEVEALLGLFAEARKRGESEEGAVRFALRAVLVSPHFLFRIEVPRGERARPVSDWELASRLSYFLWSSMPDAELFALAAAGKLRAPGVLEGQTRRLLRAPKARAFADNFAGQWLRVHELQTSAQPDGNKFPEYTPTLRDAMAAEPIEFFHALLRENGSILRLLDADYTYANPTLAQHYGLEVKGDGFQRVALPDGHRGGVVTMGAVLTLTSYPRRTSPVLRGKWILEEILDAPAPPPPPIVKSLPSSDKVRDGLSFRQQLEQHRKDESCAGCHKRLDPLGFGLENFDAIGRWRTEIAGQPVDASGEMVTGEKFTGPVELKKILLKQKDEFARNLTARLFGYALNRGLEAYDVPTVRRAAAVLAQADYRIESLILEIVQSYPFQNRRGSGPD